MVFSIKVKEGSYRRKYTSSFLICSNLNDSQTFKSSSCKKWFSPVCMLQMQLASMNVFCSMRQLEDVIFSQSLSLLCDFFNRHIAVFFETSVLKEVRILRTSYLHNNSVVLMLMLMLSSKKAILYYTYTYLKNFCMQLTFFMITFFTLFIF